MNFELEHWHLSILFRSLKPSVVNFLLFVQYSTSRLFPTTTLFLVKENTKQGDKIPIILHTTIIHSFNFKLVFPSFLLYKRLQIHPVVTKFLTITPQLLFSPISLYSHSYSTSPRCPNETI